jgi:hypothetical protein
MISSRRSNSSSKHSSTTSAWFESLKLPTWQQLTAGGLAVTQAVAAVAAMQLSAAEPSWAVLNSPNAKIPRSAEAALRR